MSTHSGLSPIEKELWNRAKKRWSEEAERTVETVLCSHSSRITCKDINYRAPKTRIMESPDSFPTKTRPQNDILIENKNNGIGYHVSRFIKNIFNSSTNKEKHNRKGTGILLDKQYRPGLAMLLIDVVISGFAMIFS